MERLDAFLQKHIETTYGVSLSRTYVQKLLEKGGVILNNEVIKKKGFKFKPEVAMPMFKDSILQKVITEYKTGIKANTEADLWHESEIMGEDVDPEKLKRAADLKPDILFENDDFMVVYKPQGVLSHPGRGDQNRDSMVYRFIKYMQTVHKYVPRAGLVHRLDLETQGLLLFAKNMESYNELKRQFEEQRITKVYLATAVVQKGKLNNMVRRIAAESRGKYEQIRQILEQGSENEVLNAIHTLPFFELNGFIAQIRGATYMRFEMDKNILTRNNGNLIKTCDSTLYPLYMDEDNLLFFVVPHTGRTHQIRAQLKYLGAPVDNDHIYRGIHTPRGMLQLMSFEIGFSLKGQKYLFRLPFTKFQRFLV